MHASQGMTGDEEVADKEVAAESTRRLGVLLTGFLVLMVVGNLSSIGMFLFARDTARAADPLAPEWSLLARALFAGALGVAAVAMLLKKRIGLYAFYGLLVLSMPLNIARGLSVGKTIISAAAPAALMAMLVRKRMAAFDLVRTSRS